MSCATGGLSARPPRHGGVAASGSGIEREAGRQGEDPGAPVSPCHCAAGVCGGSGARGRGGVVMNRYKWLQQFITRRLSRGGGGSGGAVRGKCRRFRPGLPTLPADSDRLSLRPGYSLFAAARPWNWSNASRACAAYAMAGLRAITPAPGRPGAGHGSTLPGSTRSPGPGTGRWPRRSSLRRSWCP